MSDDIKEILQVDKESFEPSKQADLEIWKRNQVYERKSTIFGTKDSIP